MKKQQKMKVRIVPQRMLHPVRQLMKGQKTVMKKWVWHRK